MPKSFPLSNEEEAKILAYNKCGKSAREVARLIGRSHKVVTIYLKNPALYDKKKKRGVTTKLSPQDKRVIYRLASNSTLSSHQITQEAGVNITPRRIRQVINSNKNLQSEKMKPAPRLKVAHIEARLSFAKENMARAWNLVSFVFKFLFTCLRGCK